MKHITVIPATGGAYRDLTLEPGTTARDVKRALELSNDNVLTNGRGAEPIADDENLYETLSDGAKLYATTSVEWGGIIFDLLNYLLAPPSPKERVRICRTYNPAGGQVIAVPRNPIPYWMERGWVREGREYCGKYFTQFGRWAGRITESPGGRVDTYIAQPPRALESHPHWPCFRKREDGWYFVHPVHDVPDVSAAILAVEKTLNESFNPN